MAHYKRDAASNRDALFGGTGSSGGASGRAGGPTRTRPQPPPPRISASTSPRPASSSAAGSPPSRLSSTSSASSHGGGDAVSKVTPGPSSIFGGKVASRSNFVSVLNGQAKIDKMAEAEDYRLKAKKAMTRGVFSRPDPISAGNFYKRAADAYKQCGENRLERLHRIASGDCQMGQDAFATAAGEYTRAAELAEASEETLQRKRQECHKLHLDAANAWSQMGEKGRAAESTMKAAFGLVMGEEATKPIEKKALASIEEAIEAFVPDPLNRKRNYRRTGASAYDDPDATNPDEARRTALALAKQNIITDSYAHETLFQAGAELIRRRHYESALYAYGAGTASLESEGFATVSLSRAYVSETIMTLAMGDVVAAKRDFQTVHLQRTSYLASRECALAEDLIRACDAMDSEALDEARSRTGPHRAALANLEPALRELVGEIRVSGRAKKIKQEGSKKKEPSAVIRGGAPAASMGSEKGSCSSKQPSNTIAARPPAPKAKELSGEELQQSLEEGFAEMDDIMNQMGLNDVGNDDDEVDLT